MMIAVPGNNGSLLGITSPSPGERFVVCDVETLWVILSIILAFVAELVSLIATDFASTRAVKSYGIAINCLIASTKLSYLKPS